MKPDLSEAIEQLVQEAPGPWLEAVCAGLQSSSAGATGENMLQRLPGTHNGDLAYRLREVIRLTSGTISWEALSSAIALCASLCTRWQPWQKVELLWAGPAPAERPRVVSTRCFTISSRPPRGNSACHIRCTQDPSARGKFSVCNTPRRARCD
jgi:hypothetical protein